MLWACNSRERINHAWENQGRTRWNRGLLGPGIGSLIAGPSALRSRLPHVLQDVDSRRIGRKPRLWVTNHSPVRIFDENTTRLRGLSLRLTAGLG
jgi:hypothetical protein